MRDEKVKAHLVLPKKLLLEMDRFVSPRGRSQFVADATREKLERLRLAKAIENAAGTWKDEDYPEFRTKADVRRYVRRLRFQASRRLSRRLRG